MGLALYDPATGYYARAARRSGRTGDFFTSVDVGSLFGTLLAVQVQEMAALLRTQRPPRSLPVLDSRDTQQDSGSTAPLDLVEAGAGDGRLARDVLLALREADPALYRSIRLHLVEASARARAEQAATLGEAAGALASSGDHLPDAFEGVLIANELLDAMPVHQVVMREEGLREVLVDVDPAAGALRLVEAPPSTPALQRYLDLAGVRLEPGARAEINLRAVEWIRNAARRLRRGFMILIDYGHEARELYSVTHATGTLTAFRGHRSAGPERAAASSWLSAPGEQDLTAHVDFTSVRAAAEAEGMDTIAFLDQTYFLLGLFQSVAEHDANTSADRRSAKASAGHDANTSADRWSAKASAERHHELKTLIMPGGLGSTMKVLILGKDVGTPPLKGCSFKVRVT